MPQSGFESTTFLMYGTTLQQLSYVARADLWRVFFFWRDGDRAFYNVLSWICLSLPQGSKAFLSCSYPGNDYTFSQLSLYFSILPLDWELSEGGHYFIHSFISYVPKLAHYLVQGMCISYGPFGYK